MKTRNSTLTSLIPVDVQHLYGKRHLVLGENAEAYDDLLSKFVVALSPKGIIECLYTKDIVDLTWDIQRIRGFEVSIINNERTAALGAILAVVVDDGQKAFYQNRDEGKLLANRFISGETKAKEELTSQMAQHGFDENSVTAEAFSQKLPILEVVHRMLAAAESRRDKMIREIERHRETLGRHLREIVETNDNEASISLDTQKLDAPEKMESEHPTPSTGSAV